MIILNLICCAFCGIGYFNSVRPAESDWVMPTLHNKRTGQEQNCQEFEECTRTHTRTRTHEKLTHSGSDWLNSCICSAMFVHDFVTYYFYNGCMILTKLRYAIWVLHHYNNNDIAIFLFHITKYQFHLLRKMLLNNVNMSQLFVCWFNYL